MQIQNNGYLSIEQLTEKYLSSPQKADTHETRDGLSFQEILESRSLQGGDGTLKFSRHALGRLNDRNIELSAGQLERLEEEELEESGAEGNQRFSGDRGSAGVYRQRTESDGSHCNGQHGNKRKHIH